jgi:hypothetical protein
MKTSRSVKKAGDSVKPRPEMVLPEEKQDALPLEPNLSPERVADGASTTTAVLSQILAQQMEFRDLRHWGINE